MTDRISLYELEFASLILIWESNVVYSNQVAGTVCLQPEVEGVLMPLAQNGSSETCLTLSEDVELTFEGHGDRFDEDLAVLFDEILARHPATFGMKVDREKFELSWEAWVYLALPRKFSPATHAVLTWANSD